MNKKKIIFFITLSVLFFTSINVFAYCETNKEYRTSYAGSCECAPGTQKCYPELEGVGIQTFYCSNNGCGEDSSTPSTSTELVSVISGQSESSIDITASSTETPSSTTTSSSPTVVISGGTLPNPVQWSTFSELIDAIANWLLTIGLVLAPLMFVIGGVMFATAYGNASKIQSAKSLMIYTGIGILVVLLAKSLVEVLKGFIG